MCPIIAERLHSLVSLKRDDQGKLPTLSGSMAGDIQIPDGFNKGGYDLDYFKFELKPDWLYRVEADLGSMRMLTLTEVSNNASVDTILVRQSPKADDPAPVIEISPKEPGEAFIAVGSTSEIGVLAYHSGTYNLKVTAELDDHGNTASEATMIQVGVAQPGKVQSRADEDWFAFEAEEGVKYDIFTDLISMERSGLTLIDADGEAQLETKITLTATDGDPNILDWVAPSSGIYYVPVWNIIEAYPEFEMQTNAAITGTYQLTVVRSDGEQLSEKTSNPPGTREITNQSGQVPESNVLPTQPNVAVDSNATPTPQPDPTKTSEAETGGGGSAPSAHSGTVDLSLFVALLATVGLVAVRRRFAGS